MAGYYNDESFLEETRRFLNEDIKNLKEIAKSLFHRIRGKNTIEL